MSVETFDPRSLKPAVTGEILRRLLAAARMLAVASFGLSPAEVERFAPLARHGDVDWGGLARELADDDIVALIRLFTLAEGALQGWEAGAKSPVIPLAAELKHRNAYPQALTGWIKSNTDNRFLPYGSLLDRL